MRLPLSRFAVLLGCIVLVGGTSGCKQGTGSSSPSQSAVSSSSSQSPALNVREVDSPAGPDSREPEMYATSDGRIIFSWVEKVGTDRYALRFAVRNAEGWSEPRTVAEGSNWFVNWADFPSVVSLGGGSLAAHWLVKSGPGTYAYDVNVSLSKDGGKSWSKALVPHNDRTQTEHGFVSLFPLADGRLGASWVDGRNLKDLDVGEDHGPIPESTTLRYAAINPAGKLSDEAQLDDRICECCQTSAAVTSEGAIVVYRNRSEHEVRDIYFVRQVEGKWSEPLPIHQDGWEISACPVNGPSVSADGRRVAVAWYTEAQDTPRVKISFSSDAGRSFGKPIQVDDGKPVGRVDVVMLPDSSALVCWLEGTSEKGEIKVRRLRPDGSLSKAGVVTETDITRSSGFPRMARLGNEIFFAWTQFGKPSRVGTATASLEYYK
jgi:hypothetical protein